MLDDVVVKPLVKETGWTRFWGGVKAVGSFLEMAGGVALCATGIGAPIGALLIVHGADGASAGIIQAATGEETEPLIHKGVRKLAYAASSNPTTAREVADGVDNGIVVAGAGASTGAAVAEGMGAMKVATAESTAAEVVNVETTTSNGRFTVNSSKFDYFFGRVVNGPEHNVARSAQNLKDLNTLGITSDSQLMGVFNEAFEVRQ